MFTSTVRPMPFVGKVSAMPMTSQGQFVRRLNEALDDIGQPLRGRQAWVQKQLQVAQPTARGYFQLDGYKPDRDKMRKLARALGVSVRWLDYGEGAKNDATENSDVVLGLHIVHDAARELPVISLIQAGAGVEFDDPYPRGQGFDMVTIDPGLAKELSRVAFAMEIEGDSMTRPDGEGFLPGDIVIIDPRVEPRPGDCVVAKLERDNSATFKKYRARGVTAAGFNSFELVPLNPDHATILVDEKNPGIVVGTMMEHRRRRRR
jgi:SOS-response transcriptional repressor LexA